MAWITEAIYVQRHRKEIEYKLLVEIVENAFWVELYYLFEFWLRQSLEHYKVHIQFKSNIQNYSKANE